LVIKVVSLSGRSLSLPSFFSRINIKEIPPLPPVWVPPSSCLDVLGSSLYTWSCACLCASPTSRVGFLPQVSQMKITSSQFNYLVHPAPHSQ
jgi:hypothetical protein